MTTPSTSTNRRRAAEITFVTGCVGATITLIHGLMAGGLVHLAVSLAGLVLFFLLPILIFLIGALIALAFDASFMEAESAQAA